MKAVLGIGIDLVDVSEAQRLFERWGARFLKRVLTDRECEYVLSFAHPAKPLAARLAAKEAVYKALQSIPGTRAVGWRDIEVERSPEGRPSILLLGRAAELARQGGIARISVSLTHTERSAAAVALVEGS